MSAADHIPAMTDASNPDNKWIGKRTPRPDGADKVTGRAAYAADTTMQMYAALGWRPLAVKRNYVQVLRDHDAPAG